MAILDARNKPNSGPERRRVGGGGGGAAGGSSTRTTNNGRQLLWEPIEFVARPLGSHRSPPGRSPAESCQLNANQGNVRQTLLCNCNTTTTTTAAVASAPAKVGPKVSSLSIYFISGASFKVRASLTGGPTFVAALKRQTGRRKSNKSRLSMIFCLTPTGWLAGWLRVASCRRLAATKCELVKRAELETTTTSTTTNLCRPLPNEGHEIHGRHEKRATTRTRTRTTSLTCALHVAVSLQTVALSVVA